MKNIDWNTVKNEVARPTPGGYIAQITRVEDVEDKEYLRIEWDFYDGEFKGVNRETFAAFGFWPISFIRSYKEKALRFFKGFKTAVEESNGNYVFRNDPQSLVGRYMGVVLGEEEYQANDGSVKTRLYVAEVRSGKTIRDGEYRVPDLKKLPAGGYTAPSPAGGFAPPAFNPVTYDDPQLPF